MLRHQSGNDRTKPITTPVAAESESCSDSHPTMLGADDCGRAVGQAGRNTVGGKITAKTEVPSVFT